jgi:hypothetical protein
MKEVKGSEAISATRWSDLKKLVLKKFCNHSEINKVEQKFLMIKAGNTTHQEYTSKYTSLARLVTHFDKD